MKWDYRFYLRKLTASEKHYLRSQHPRYHCFKWIVTHDIHYVLNDIWHIIVPRGFLSDGCSGPGRDMWDPRSWIVHDWLYYTGGYCQFESHSWLFIGQKVCREAADSIFKGRYFYRRWAVRLFARKYWDGMSQAGKPCQIRDDILQPLSRSDSFTRRRVRRSAQVPSLEETTAASCLAL